MLWTVQEGWPYPALPPSNLSALLQAKLVVPKHNIELLPNIRFSHLHNDTRLCKHWYIQTHTYRILYIFWGILIHTFIYITILRFRKSSLDYLYRSSTLSECDRTLFNGVFSCPSAWHQQTKLCTPKDELWKQEAVSYSSLLPFSRRPHFLLFC